MFLSPQRLETVNSTLDRIKSRILSSCNSPLEVCTIFSMDFFISSSASIIKQTYVLVKCFIASLNFFPDSLYSSGNNRFANSLRFVPFTCQFQGRIPLPAVSFTSNTYRVCSPNSLVGKIAIPVPPF